MTNRAEWARSVVLALMFGAACDAPQTQPPTVEVGVFYGGQVQKVQRISVDRNAPPKIGFRIELSNIQSEDRNISCEVVSVGPAGRRVTRTTRIEVPKGATRVDHVIPLPADARLGIWNVRVTDDRRVLADRALFLVED